MSKKDKNSVSDSIKTEAEAEKQPPLAPKTEGKAEGKIHKSLFWQRALRQIELAILFLIIGAALVFFLVYQPATKQYTRQNEETTRLQDIETKYNTLLDDYNTLNTHHQIAVTLVNIYKIQNNVNIARIALMNDDETRLSIALGYVEKYIGTLDISHFPEKVDLSARVTAIKDYLPNNKEKALAELDALFADLLLLSNNMEITE